MEGAGAEGRGGGGGGGGGSSTSASGGGNGGEEKQVVAAATGQAPSMETEAREGTEEREVGEEEHQLVPAIPYTTPAPLGRKARVSIKSDSDQKKKMFHLSFLFFFVGFFSPSCTTLIERFRHAELGCVEVVDVSTNLGRECKDGVDKLRNARTI